MVRGWKTGVLVTMADDDLRFGDVSGGSSTDSIIDTLTNTLIAIVMIYVILKVLETLLSINIPLV
jgi:hypothetical protein